MDYILFGFGTGATLALGGWLFRDLGPRIRDRSPAEGDVLSARDMVSRMAWARFCSACGAALALAGILLMLVTIGTAFWNPSDDQGFEVVLIAYAVVAVLMMVWTGLYLRFFGAAGIIRPREAKPAPVRTEASQTVKPGEPDGAAEEDPAGQPEKTFDEVAAAPGGLGRFKAFFRKDTPPEVPDEVPDDMKTAGGTDAGSSAVERTDDDVAGDDDDESGDKRLSADDPLVTAVMGEIPEERIVEPDLEASLVSELMMPGRGSERVADNNDNTAWKATPGFDQDQQASSPEDQALDVLRKKRLARLSGQSNKE